MCLTGKILSYANKKSQFLMPLGKYIDVSIWHWLKDEILEKPYSKHRTLQNIISMYAIKNRYSSLCIITQTFFISQFLVNFIKNLGEIHIYDYHQVDKHLALNLSSTRDSVCFVTVSYTYVYLQTINMEV